MNPKNSTRRAGDLDTTFGTDGEVSLSILPTYIGTDRLLQGVLILPDNKILVGLGVSINPLIGFGAPPSYGLARLSPDGILDKDFGVDGVITDNFRPKESSKGGRLLRLEDGRLFMLGSVGINEGGTSIPHLAMACYTEDYKLDTTFGGEGTGHLVIENSSTEIYMSRYANVTQQADGKLLICTEYHEWGNAYKTTGILYRLHTNGTLDTTFNGNGRLEIKGQDPDAATGLKACLAQAGGKIVVVGHICFQPGLGTAVIARFHNDGTLDKTFGRRNSPGYHTVPVGGLWTQFNNLLSTPRGFVATGKAGEDEPGTVSQGIMVGITKEGLEDLDFNDGKPLITKYTSETETSWSDGYMQPDGKLVLSSAGRPFLSRWLSNGSPDTEFGTDGAVLIRDTGVRSAFVVSRPDSKILWAANVGGIGGSIGSLRRYLG
jgi:uncharacterized delta-60 repeat protein